MAESTEFSFASILDWFKKNLLPSWLSNLPTMVTDWLGSLGGGLFGMFAGDKIKEVGDSVGKVSEGFTEKLNPELTATRESVASNISTFFAKRSAALAIDDATRQKLEAATLDAAQTFYQDGIPELKDERPQTAYTSAIKFRAELLERLLGTDTVVGILDPNKKNLKEVAERIATQITGVPAEATLTSLVANPPKYGLVAMLAATQVDSTQEIAFNADPSLEKKSVKEIAEQHKVDNKNITNAKPVQTNTAPAPTPPKAEPEGISFID